MCMILKDELYTNTFLLVDLIWHGCFTHLEYLQTCASDATRLHNDFFMMFIVLPCHIAYVFLYLPRKRQPLISIVICEADGHFPLKHKLSDIQKYGISLQRLQRLLDLSFKPPIPSAGPINSDIISAAEQKDGHSSKLP